MAFAETIPVHAAPNDHAHVHPRVGRTTRALGRAPIGLLEQRAFDAITGPDILDRAGVGWTAFDAHYRNKGDVLLSSYEGVFAWLEPLVERPFGAGPPDRVAGGRLFPITELLAHVGEARALVDALRGDGLLDEMWALLAGHAARMIARRPDGWPGYPATPRVTPASRLPAGQPSPHASAPFTRPCGANI